MSRHIDFLREKPLKHMGKDKKQNESREQKDMENFYAECIHRNWLRLFQIIDSNNGYHVVDIYQKFLISGMREKNKRHPLHLSYAVYEKRLI